MCTLVLLIRPGHAVPVMIAANRDERIDRPWDPPCAWWPDRPGIIAGRDRTGGGTWMGVNRAGVMAAVLNRPGSLGPAPGKRSRGELPLIALEQDSAEAAVTAVGRLDAGAWRSFNMVVADRHRSVFLRGLGTGCAEAEPLGAGLWMVTAHDPNDQASPRIARHLHRFRASVSPDEDGWRAWRDILQDRGGEPGEQINVVPRAGFGTVSSSLLSLGRDGSMEWLFAAGPPHSAPFERVRLEPDDASISL